MKMFPTILLLFQYKLQENIDWISIKNYLNWICCTNFSLNLQTTYLVIDNITQSNRCGKEAVQYITITIVIMSKFFKKRLSRPKVEQNWSNFEKLRMHGVEKTKFISSMLHSHSIKGWNLFGKFTRNNFANYTLNYEIFVLLLFCFLHNISKKHKFK